MELTGAEIVCESLLKEGADVVFGLPGGAVLPLYGALSSYPGIRHILVRHEQAAAMAADGYSRATGKVGVCVATSGPGATNLVTGIAAAQMDSVAMVAITGQVPRPAIGRDAFQETDVTGVTLPITKHNMLVMDVKDVAQAIHDAFHIARTGRPGPVLVDIPRDVLLGEKTEFVWPTTTKLPGYKVPGEAPESQVAAAAELINKAERPLIMAGHGVLISHAYGLMTELAEKAQVPVITTLLGISSIPSDHELNLGMSGMHGMAYANIAIDEADLIIGLGMRFDDRVTGRISDFAPNAKIIHVDIDDSEVDKNVKTTVGLVGDLKAVLGQMLPKVEANVHIDWLRHIEELKIQHPSHLVRDSNELLPQYVLQRLTEVTQGRGIVVTGVGQHQMWAAQHCKFTEPNTFITSGGLGTMGFEVPAALGAQVGRPDSVVWSVCGDGGFQMTMCDIATAVESGADVKFAILNNTSLGMVHQLQDIFFEKDYVASEYTANPDFVKIAEAYGIRGIRVTQQDQVVNAVQQAMETAGPVIVDFMVKEDEIVYPFIPSGQSVKEMLEEPAPGEPSSKSSSKRSSTGRS
ncbi:MAG: biosynthetic-type acetolactate synthase large subunit [Chloroflexi bacterium]|nr:biosynthetic-type acetolactate synthase large subunit [Chloroflexota bacterium]MDA1269707.1 biosynthetic-type acetolactate synthase large subunit [Chloroflexota bacterium]PKB58063.1 MAG: acetolactate synthase, large subunit, biosynthetic type [SAR202 cluster bacterium Casp-Chloro-G2]